MSQLSYSPGEAPGSCDEKEEGGGALHTGILPQGRAPQGALDSDPPDGAGDGHGIGASRRAACRGRARAAARGQMGCINLGAGSSGPRCSVLSRASWLGLQMWAWRGGGWVTAPDVCRLKQWDDCGTQWQHPRGPRGLELRGLGQGASVCILSSPPTTPALGPQGFRAHRTQDPATTSQERLRPHFLSKDRAQGSAQVTSHDSGPQQEQRVSSPSDHRQLGVGRGGMVSCGLFSQTLSATHWADLGIPWGAVGVRRSLTFEVGSAVNMATGLGPGDSEQPPGPLSSDADGAAPWEVAGLGFSSAKDPGRPQALSQQS